MADLKIEDIATEASVTDISEIATPIDEMPASMEGPGPGSSLGAFNEGLLNEMLAVGQGSSPMTRSIMGAENYRPLGVLITEETDFAGPNEVYQIGPNQFGTFDPEKHVVFSEGGRLNVYQRNPDMEEGRLSRFGRLLGLGLFTPNRASIATGGTSALQRNVEALEKSGITPTMPLAAEGTGPARVAQITQAVPFAGGPVERGMARTRGEVERAAGDLVEQYGRGAGPEMAGESLREAGANWLTNWRKTGAKMDDDLAKAFEDAGVDRIDLKKFAEALDSPFEDFDNVELAKQFSDEWLDKWRDVLKSSNGQVSYNDLKALRRRLGKMLERPMVVSDQDRGQLKALYRSLAEDLETAARQGGDDLVDQVRERNAYWRDGFDRIEKSMKHVLNERTNAESIFERVMSSAKGKGARANARFLRDVRNSVGEDAWNDLASSVMVRMGTGPATGQTAETAFNPMTFLNNYRNMGDEAKTILFSGHEQAARNLDSLIKDVMPAIERVQRLENVSRSGEFLAGGGLGALASMGAYTGDLMQVLGAIGTAAGANVVSRSLMNPRFTRWLARTATAAKNAKSIDQQFWTRQLPRLRAIVSANPELEPALAAFEQQAEAQ